MKVQAFRIDEFQAKSLLRAFRSKESMIAFWMEAAKIISIYDSEAAEAVDLPGVIEVRTAKMKRIFVEYDGKSFSAAFPMSIKTVDGFNICTLKSGIQVDNKVSSEVLRFLDSSSFDQNDLDGFIDGIFDSSDDDPNTLWRVISELVRTDDGYVRADHDPKNENGNLHPLDHLDIFYSQGATLKVGLLGKMSLTGLSDLLNIRTDCRFLNDAKN
ncbi:hypothetical protein ABM428_05525 [Sulfitobacter sp. TCYB15]|uniref:Uncharacterized protein n=1 Tax=Sulfitobacter sp. TCYB15 TaxID=3229275 RepID=A0AAU8C5X6_9RHOB